MKTHKPLCIYKDCWNRAHQGDVCDKHYLLENYKKRKPSRLFGSWEDALTFLAVVVVFILFVHYAISVFGGDFITERRSW